MKILFVCHANMVRSFMAERVLKHLLRRRGIQDVEVSSAGLLVPGETPADENARRILREKGIDDEGHRSRLLTEELIGNADLIVVMERKQLRDIGDRYPCAVNKVRLLKSYLPDRGCDEAERDVQDPYRRSAFHYRLCYAEISLAIEELSKCI